MSLLIATNCIVCIGNWFSFLKPRNKLENLSCSLLITRLQAAAMPRAALRNTNFTLDAIDAENGVIRGVRIAENGKMAMFQNTAGKAVSFKVTPEWIEAFMSHAGNRSLPVHWTHDYASKQDDTLHAKVGAIKNLRLDPDSGNMIADLHVAPTEKRDLIFWNAQHDTTGMMMSAVFTYGAHDPNCIPLSVEASDLVGQGAATTALLSKHQPEDTDMTADEINKAIADGIKAALANPETRKALLAADTTAVDKEKAEAAALEVSAGVTDADKKPGDENLSPAMCAATRVNRAAMRKLAELKEEAPKLAEAHLAQKIGSGDFKLTQGKGDEKDFDSVLKAELAANPKMGRGEAIRLSAKRNPALYNAARAAGKI